MFKNVLVSLVILGVAIGAGTTLQAIEGGSSGKNQKSTRIKVSQPEEKKSVKQAQNRTPTLLWKKEFATLINSVAMSADGRYIAVSTDAESIGPTTGEPFKGSKLCFFDKSGKLLWEYEKGDNYGVVMAVMSDSGSYTAAGLVEKVVVDRAIIDGKYYETVELHVKKILFFDEHGNLLWERDATGCPQISKGGEYILVNTEYYEDIKSTELYYTLFDKHGNALWQKPYTLESGFVLFGSDISIDGNYIIIGNTLYDRNGTVLCVYDVRKDTLPVISPYGNYIALRPYPTNGNSKILFYDKNGRLLWELSKQGRKKVITFSPNENYIIVDTGREIEFYDKDGRLLWSKEKEKEISPSRCGGYAFTEESKFFVMGFKNKVHFYNKNGETIWKLSLPGVVGNPHIFPSQNIDMSNNGKYLAIGAGNVLYLYDNSKAVK